MAKAHWREPCRVGVLASFGGVCSGAWNPTGLIRPGRLEPGKPRRTPGCLTSQFSSLTVEGFHRPPTLGLCLLSFKICDSVFSLFCLLYLVTLFFKPRNIHAREKQSRLYRYLPNVAQRHSGPPCVFRELLSWHMGRAGARWGWKSLPTKLKGARRWLRRKGEATGTQEEGDDVT